MSNDEGLDLFFLVIGGVRKEHVIDVFDFGHVTLVVCIHFDKVSVVKAKDAHSVVRSRHVGVV